LELWDTITMWMNEVVGVSSTLFARFAETLVLVLLYIIVLRILRGVVDRRVPDAHRKFVAKKTLSYVLGVFALVALLFIWLGGVSGFAASIGVLSAGVAIALQTPLVNLAGWLFIILRRPFVIGDRIKIGEHAGDVIDRRLFQFSIIEIGAWVDADQSTGRIIHIPNGWVFKNSTINYTQAFEYLWNELVVTVTFESNWERAKEILTKIAQAHSAIRDDEHERKVRRDAEHHNIIFHHLKPIVWTSVIDCGVNLTIRYICGPRARRSTESAIWEDVLTKFKECDDVDFAYPTTRFYDNPVEGKPDARAKLDEFRRK
jgi:small-conductance mechanosensitive channel